MAQSSKRAGKSKKNGEKIRRGSVLLSASFPDQYKESARNMKHNLIRWCVAALMLALLATFFSSPALAEVQPIPLDLKTTGRVLPKEGWISETEYEDESIHIVMYEKPWKPKYSNEWVTCRWVRIKIADPTQLRTTMSYEDYENPNDARPKDMAAKLNSVVACNDDFMKYTYDSGYVVRQGVEYRRKPDGKRDVLIIDDKGDFSFVMKATEETLQEKLDELAAQGRTVINAFTFGPVLVVDGQVQEIDVPNNDKREPNLCAQRIAICQLGELEYGIFEVDGGNGSGMKLFQVADFIVREEVFPECKVAFNLDGGGSTNLMLNGKRVHKTLNSRGISGLIYFASAVVEE